MPTALLLAIAWLGQPKADPDQFPLALHRSMEIDDLDRELQRLHDSVLLKRGQYNSTQRLAQRGLISRAELERDGAALRYEEAHEAETIAYRALKAYERDVMGRASAPDEVKAYTLLLDWLKKQETMARVDLDFKEYTLEQTRKLYQRKAISRQELEDAELGKNTARASVALSQSRQAQVVMELAARRGEKTYDDSEYARLKSDYLKARIRYFEIIAEGARSRLAIATERSRRGLIPTNELGFFQRATDDADSTLTAERRKLSDAEDAARTAASKPR
jgi:multidrug resistance efflux pump